MGGICSSKKSDAPDTAMPVPEIEENYECVEDDKLEEYLTTLQTGDIVLVNGEHKWGTVTRVVDWTHWDHVGVIVRVPDNENAVEERKKLLAEKGPLPQNDDEVRVEFEEPVGGQLQLFEATPLGTFSYPLKQHFQARNHVNRYVAIRKLTPPLTPDQLENVETFLQTVWARPYGDYCEIAKAVVISDCVDGSAENKDKQNENLSQIFCSELVAEFFQRANLLPEKSFNSNELMPSAFEEGGIVDRLLIKPWSLGGKCVVIKRPGNAKYWV